MMILNEFAKFTTYFEPLYTFLVVFSVLMIFIQWRFPLTSKQMLFIGVFVTILTLQISAVQAQILAPFELARPTSDTIKLFSVIAIQVALIIFTFYKNRPTEKTALRK